MLIWAFHNILWKNPNLFGQPYMCVCVCVCVCACVCVHIYTCILQPLILTLYRGKSYLLTWDFGFRWTLVSMPRQHLPAACSGWVSAPSSGDWAEVRKCPCRLARSRLTLWLLWPPLLLKQPTSCSQHLVWKPRYGYLSWLGIKTNLYSGSTVSRSFSFISSTGS